MACNGHFPTDTNARSDATVIQQACFEVIGNVCAIRAYTQKPWPNEKTLQILFTAFACEGNCWKNRQLLFF
jgi:hypothetical protein